MKDLPSEEFLQRIRPKNVPAKFDNDDIYANTLMFYLFANQFVEGQVVLDAACGYGYGSYLFAQTAKRVTGVDLDPGCANYAIEHYRAENLEYHQMDVTDLAFKDNRFSVVVSIETMEHLPPEKTEIYLDELKRVLKPGGTLVLSTPNRTATATREKPMSGHINEKTVAELRKLINSRFVNTKFYYFLRAPQSSETRRPSPSANSTIFRKSLRFLKRLILRPFGFIKRRILPKRVQPILPLLRTRQVYRMRTPDDEKYGLFQIVVAQKPNDSLTVGTSRVFRSSSSTSSS